MSEKGYIAVPVILELLTEMLFPCGLPAGYKITNVYPVPKSDTGVVHLLIEGPGLPPVKNGWPEVHTAIYHTERSHSGFSQVVRVEFVKREQ